MLSCLLTVFVFFLVPVNVPLATPGRMMVTFPGGDGETLHATGPGWMPERLEETLRKWLSDGFKVIMEKRPDLTSADAKDSRMFLSG